MPTVKIEDISTVKNEIYYLLIKWNLFRMLRWNIYSYFKNEIYSSSKKEKYSYTIKIPTISVKKSANHSNWVPTTIIFSQLFHENLIHSWLYKTCTANL